MKKVFNLILVLCMVLSAVSVMAEEGTYGNFIVEEDETTVTIKGCHDTGVKELFIPGEINGKKVQIAEDAFISYSKYKNLEELIIGEGIEYLPKGFHSDNLRKITLPESLVEIGAFCFYGAQIEEIDLKNVKKINSDAFYRCGKLKTVKHNGKLEYIGTQAFYGCVALTDIDLTAVKYLGNASFEYCQKLKEVRLEKIEDWNGIKNSHVRDEDGYYGQQYPVRHGGRDFYHGLRPYDMAPPFVACQSLETIYIRLPENYTDDEFPSLTLYCNNVKSFIIENYQEGLSKVEFGHVSYDNSKGGVYVHSMPNNVVIYSNDPRAREYADKLNATFSLLETYEVEPKIQSIHGGIVLKNNFVERITQIAEANGGMVVTSGDNISVQKNGKNLAIIGSDVYYTQNGTVVKESLYYKHNFLKMPEKALENVLGADTRKSEKYKKALSAYSGQIHRIAGTIETPYGSVAEYYTGGVMHGVANELVFIKWNGETIEITKDAPYYNSWCHGRWSKIELSKDGKILTVTYPENEKRLEFHNSEIPTILWDEGTYIITANLETGEVTRLILPLKKAEITTEEPQRDYEEMKKDDPRSVFEKDSMTITTSILQEPQNGPANMFDGNYTSYCVITTRDETKPEYIQFDLGEVKKVEKLGLAFRMGDMRTTYFDIRVSRDGVNFETVVPKRGSDPNNNLQYFHINKDAQYIRMYGYSNTQNKYWVSITEAEVYINE